MAGVAETLLVPLISKATESQQARPIFEDRKAQEILAHIDVDLARLHVPRKTAIMMCMRAKKLDEVTRDFLDRYPDGQVVHLGCGLDSRCERVAHGAAPWYDLDLPGVIALRRQFFPKSVRYHLLASSASDLAWLTQVAEPARPTLVVAEGLLMYLSAVEVRSLVLGLKQVFPTCWLAGDAFSRLTASQASKHPSLQEIGARVQWGVDDPRELESWAVGIRLLEEWFFAQSPDLPRLGLGYRLMFGLAGRIPAANRAHRILFYCLTEG